MIITWVLVMANNNHIYRGYIRNEVAADITNYLAGTITGFMTDNTLMMFFMISIVYILIVSVNSFGICVTL